MSLILDTRPSGDRVAGPSSIVCGGREHCVRAYRAQLISRVLRRMGAVGPLHRAWLRCLIGWRAELRARRAMRRRVSERALYGRGR